VDPKHYLDCCRPKSICSKVLRSQSVFITLYFCFFGENIWVGRCGR